MTSSIDSWLRQKRVERAQNVQRADLDPEFRAALKERARRDPVFFFNEFAWTYDPRPEAKPNHFPFLTYPFQDDYIRELESAFRGVYDLHTDKSRDMGVSWMVLAWIVHKWIFEPSFNALVGSRKEDYVDNYQPDSLFGKMSYLIDRLPSWILPEGYDRKKHRTFCRIVNPHNGNTIQGENANQEFSRAGRYSVILLDEFAFWANDASVWTATADSSPIRFVVSTPNGKTNKFYDLKISGMKCISLHWSLHPRKDQAWYEKQKSRRTKREIAQELDLDYEASGSERVFGMLLTNKTLRDNVIINPFELDASYILEAALDYGTRNKSVLTVFAKNRAGELYAIWEWRRNMQEMVDEGHKGSMVQAIAKAYNDCPFKDRIKTIWADPSLWTKNQNDTLEGLVSIYQQLCSLQVKNLVQGVQSDKACIDRVLTLWSIETSPVLKIFKTCPGLIKELEDLMWDDWSDSQNQKKNTRETIIDKNNHSWDTFKYFILAQPWAKETTSREPRPHTYEWYMQRMGEDGNSKDLRRM